MLINNETIIKDDNPLIRQKSEDVYIPLSAEDEKLAMDMLQYVKDSIDPEKSEALNLRPAVGISAIQVGIPKKITAVYIIEDVDDKGNPTKVFQAVLANPKIVSKSSEKAYLKDGEGCLSVEAAHPGHIFRAARVTVSGYDILEKKEKTIRARGFNAVCLQHELDHFQGTLFYDHIDVKNPDKIIPGAIEI